MDTKDVMNFDIVQKVTSERVIECLSERHELSTKLYLQLISHVIKAYIDEETLPLDRMYSAFYNLWFFRLWKDYLKITSSMPLSDRTDLLDESIQADFITLNCQLCIE
jgi:hypothetical protein